MPLKSPSLLRSLVATALTCACISAVADSRLDNVRQRGKLVVGINHVMPDYVAGAKFRTPESIGAALASDLAKRLRVREELVRTDSASRAELLTTGKVDVVLAAVPENDPIRRSAVIVPTGYSAGPMAIMRTDTTIKSWEQLKGRTVCLSEGGSYVGTIAATYGATEQVYKAPADALLALRTGKCDAAVHDSTLLEELLKLPEWKKFSARLPVGTLVPLAFVVPKGDAKTQTYLQSVASEWQTKGYLTQLVSKAARSIAFEVYLDQDVPDCH